ncbi:hypothetical protein FGO68_gene13596 [Halteria grandinella]|uniref:Uncharacterized protein n=1 Tax=Halteria grandinella TaxID=5974 RepID=A0A8J8NW79_HALGN|nr:hypothetical protein FGO68_gene13596 [Halteria grandinella]
MLKLRDKIYIRSFWSFRVLQQRMLFNRTVKSVCIYIYFVPLFLMSDQTQLSAKQPKILKIRIKNKYLLIQIFSFAHYQHLGFAFMHISSLSNRQFLLKELKLFKRFMTKYYNVIQVTDYKQLTEKEYPLVGERLVLKDFTPSQFKGFYESVPRKYVQIDCISFTEAFKEVGKSEEKVEIDVTEMRCCNLEQIKYAQSVLAESSFNKMKFYSEIKDTTWGIISSISQVECFKFPHVTFQYTHQEGLMHKLRFIKPSSLGTLVLEVYSQNVEFNDILKIIIEHDLKLKWFHLVLHTPPKISLKEYFNLKFAEKQTVQFMKLDKKIFETDEEEHLAESEMDAQLSLIKQSMKIQECIFDITLTELLEYQSQISQIQIKRLIIRIKDKWITDLEQTEFEYNDLFAGEVQLICDNATRDDNKKLLTVNNCQYLAQLATRILQSYPNTQALSIDEGVQGSEIVQSLLDSQLNELKLKNFHKLQIVIRNTKKSDFYKKLISFQKHKLTNLDLELKTALPGEADELLYLLEHSATLHSLRLHSQDYFLHDRDFAALRTFLHLTHLELDCFIIDDELQCLLEEEFNKSLGSLQTLVINQALINPVKAFQGEHKTLMRLRYLARYRRPVGYVQEIVGREAEAIVRGKNRGFKFEAKFAKGQAVYTNAILVQI